MNVRLYLSSILLCSITSVSFAEDSNHSNAPFILDQSQGVFFESYSTSGFTQALLASKDSFGYRQVVLGGMLEADVQHWQGNTIMIQNPEGLYTRDTAFYLTEATFDVMANLNPLMTLYASTELSAIGQGGESGNYMNLPYAFIMIGNPEKTPFYCYGGYNAISFGQFQSSGGWDYPLTSNYFQPQTAPAFSVGYQDKQWNISTSVFDDQTLYENHMVYMLNYQNKLEHFHYGLGAGYLTHLDLNTTGGVNVNRNFPRNSANMNAGNITDAYLNLGYDALTLSGEYLRGTQKILMNLDKPSAYGIALQYSPIINKINYTAGLSYSRSLHLENVSAFLNGQDQIPYACVGLQNSWAANVTRNFLGEWLYIGLNAERDLTYENQKTYTLTLDATAYL